MGVGWHSVAIQNRRYAQGAGYRFVFHTYQDLNPELNSEASDHFKRGLRFYFNDVHKTIQPEIGLDIAPELLSELKARWPFEFHWYPQVPRFFYFRRWKEIKEAYPDIYDAYKATWETYFAWHNAESEFPFNMGILDYWRNYSGQDSEVDPYKTDPDDESVGWMQFLPDFQRQGVIDHYVENIVRHIKTRSEAPALDYRFAGVLIDVIEIWEEIEGWRDWETYPYKLGSSSLKREGYAQQYETIASGWMHFLYYLKTGLQRAFPDREIRFIYEPGKKFTESYLQYISGQNIPFGVLRAAMGDLITGEHPDLSFLDDATVRDFGYNASTLALCSSDIKGYEENLAAAGKLATHGSWFNFYGMWHRQNIGIVDVESVTMDLKLVRMIPNWDNLNGVALEERSWDGEAGRYRSPLSYADKDVLYSLQPGTNLLFAVFRSKEGKARVPKGLSVESAVAVSGYWEAVGPAEDLVFEGETIGVDWNGAKESKAFLIRSSI